MMPSNRARTALVAACLVLLAQGLEAKEFYRYTDDRGVQVLDDRVPPEYAGRGYEVVNEKGVVVRVVPRELTAEERKQADAQERLEAEARAEADRLREWDESLLVRYSTVADIESARDRALSELRIRVSILRSNKRSLKQQVETYQSQAADLERRGKKVDVARLETIEALQAEIAATDRSIADRQREIAEVEAAFQADIDRFVLLQDKVIFRRQMSATDQEGEGSDPRR